MNSNSDRPENVESTSEAVPVPRWVVYCLVVLGIAMAGIAAAQYQTNAALKESLDRAHEKLVGVELRTASLETNTNDLSADMTAATERLGLNESELKRARAQAARLREEQKKSTETLNSKLEAHGQQLDAIAGEVTDVVAEVAETQDNLEATRGQLQRAMGDLGVQSGLIARNHDELEELKRRGEREYYEFDLKRSREFARVGEVSVRLNKTDTKRNRFTVTLLSNDKIIEKKDKTLLEPVQFYTAGKGQLLELVVYELNKNRIVGYLSAPKHQIASAGPGS
jgi:chromosome segregation ATPase